MKLFIKGLFLLICLSMCGSDESNLQNTVEQYATAIDGNVGVYATLIETGETVSHLPAERFPMQSVYKFPIALAIYNRIDKGELAGDRPVAIKPSDYISEKGYSPIREQFPQGTTLTMGQLLKYCADSDGSASDILLELIGGAEAATQFLRQIGIQDMVIATTERMQVENDNIQYQNYSTPKAMNDLLATFFSGEILTEESRGRLLQDMLDTRTGQKRLRGLLPEDTPIAHKTGTSRTYNGLTRATNDAGIITLPNGKHAAVTVFVSDSRASEEEREQTIARIAKAVYDAWGK